MIKRFKCKGMVGIPDCDIKLGTEKKIVITGPNGSGKTSLLKQITHPLSSHDKYNRLKTGVDEGFIEMEIEFYGVNYKVQHLYNRNKPGQSPKVMSYLFKEENGVYNNLVENGLPTNFKSVVEKELHYSDYLYNILNIGSHNKGLIEQTTSERLDYLKKVTNQDVLTVLKDNVNNNFSQYSSNSKYIANEISKMGDIDDMKRRMSLLQSKSIELTNQRDSYQLEYNNLENVDISVLDEKIELRSQYRNQLNMYNNLRVILEDIVDDKNTLPELSYNLVYNKLIQVLTKEETRLDFLTEKINNLNTELLQIKDLNNDELILEKETLEKQVDEVMSKYKNKEFPDLINVTIDNLDRSVFIIENYILPTMENITDTSTVLELIEKENIEEYSKEIQIQLDKLIEEKDKIIHDLEQLHVASNIAELSFPSECKIPICQLRVEYEQQIKNLNINQILKNRQIEINNDINRYGEIYRERESIVTTIKDTFNRIENVKLLDVANLFGDYKLVDLFKDTIINKILVKIKEFIMYIKDTNDLELIYVKLESLKNIVKTTENNSKEKFNKINHSLEELSTEEQELMRKISNLHDKKNKLEKENFSDNLKSLKYSEIEKDKQKKWDMIESLSKEIDTINEIDIKKEKLYELVKQKNIELKENTDEYYKLKEGLERISLLTKDFDNTIKHVEKLKVLREIVGRVLPARIMDSYLDEVAKLVNFLLDGIMTIRFDTTDGIEIYSTIKAEERPASVMSQGEKSMLSIALLIAFKRMIKWDVISVDEGSAALDEDNKDKYMSMITRYIEAVDTISQIFIVSHDFFVSEGMDVRILRMEEL